MVPRLKVSALMEDRSHVLQQKEEVQGTCSSKEETSEAITMNLNVNQLRWVSFRGARRELNTMCAAEGRHSRKMT